MNEQKIVKKQLIKNMLLTLVCFSVIFTILGLIIYNQVSSSLYKSIDGELLASKEKIVNGFFLNERDIHNRKMEEIQGEEPDDQNQSRFKINPRVIYILRDKDGNIINEDTLGVFYEDYLENLSFNKNLTDKIYNITLGDSYKYRGITFIIETQDGELEYVQLFSSVEAEEVIIENFAKILTVSIAITVALSIIVSYALSKRTLEPIINSWKKQTEFVQNASHELRTPLTIIQTKQELLLSEPNKKILDKSEDINLCLKETRRLGKLIKDLMMLARADSDEIALVKEKTDIDELIKEVTTPYMDFAGMQDKKINLELNYGKEINIDRSKIHQLLIIVLDNAIKYTEAKDEITVCTYQKDGKVVIDIKDTGIGISKEGQKRAFDRFYREDKARNRETGGSGLGLSLAHYIVTAHSGAIKLMSNVPKGTIVQIRLK